MRHNPVNRKVYLKSEDVQNVRDVEELHTGPRSPIILYLGIKCTLSLTKAQGLLGWKGMSTRAEFLYLSASIFINLLQSNALGPSWNHSPTITP